MSFNNRNKIDEKICILEKNKEFLKWFKLTYGNGSFLDVEGLQKLVGKVVAWYRLKYSDKDFKAKHLDLTFVSFDYLINILSENERLTIECPYPSLRAMEMENTVTDWNVDVKRMSGEYDIIYEVEEKIISLSVDKKGFVDLEDNSGYFDGIINPKTKPIKIEDFYALLPIDNRYDEIERCLSRHYCDITLRNQIFKFAILELLNYPEYGIERAGLALKDLKEQFNDLHFDELNEVYAGQKAPKQPHVKLFRKPKSF